MLIYQDGFEQYGDMTGFLWAWESFVSCDLLGEPRDDHGIAMRMHTGGNAVYNFNQHTAIYVGIACKPKAATTGFNIRFQDALDQDQFTFTMNAQGFFQLRLGGPTDPVVATAKRKLISDGYYYLEFRLETDPKFGSVHFRLQEEIGIALINTATETTGNGITKFKIENATGDDIHFDDMYIIDNVREEYWDKWLGDIKVNTYRISGDSTPLQWHALNGETIFVGGPHWPQIDDIPTDADLTSIDAGDWGITDQFTVTQDQITEPADGAVMAISLLAMINNTGTKPNPNHTGSDWRLSFSLIRTSDGYMSSPSGMDRKLPFRYSYQVFNLIRWRPEGAHFLPNIMDTTQVRIEANPAWPQ